MDVGGIYKQAKIMVSIARNANCSFEGHKNSLRWNPCGSVARHVQYAGYSFVNRWSELTKNAEPEKPFGTISHVSLESTTFGSQQEELSNSAELYAVLQSMQ